MQTKEQFIGRHFGIRCIKNSEEDVTLGTRMVKFKIGQFEEGNLASRGVRWQKWTALLEDNCDWFAVTKAEKKVKAFRFYGGERI